MEKKKSYFPTALVLYFNYFIHGIGVSILGQYKQNFAGAWGAEKIADGTFNVSVVLTVIAALGLGRLISLPIAGPFSDKFGRKKSGLIGSAFYIAYFIGIATAPSMSVAYIFAIFGGIANSFWDTCTTPTILEIFTKKGDTANLYTKFSISLSQFLVPFMIGFVATNMLPYTTIFYVAGAAVVINAILMMVLPFPVANVVSGEEKKKAEKVKMKFTLTSIAVIAIGFTCTSTFQLWLNCNQELGKMYGLANPKTIQSYYAIGTILAIFTSTALLRKIKATKILILYPTISLVMLIAIYLIKVPAITLIGGFVIGFAGAGGVLQLAVSTANQLFPYAKGKATSLVMIASSLANYVILSVAGALTKAGGTQGPLHVLILNIVITAAGIALALFVNKRIDKELVQK